MKKLAFLLALVACVAVPMTLIRSDDTTVTGHNIRDQTPVTGPAQQQREPVILRAEPQTPFLLPHYLHEREEGTNPQLN